MGGAGADDSSNQRIYLYPTGVINILYGQHKYNNLAAAVAAIQSETFVVYPNAETTGILIGVLSVRNDIVADGESLTNTDYAKFTLVSKFGESFGGTGGLSTTTLQQAYNNSTTPEITTNSSLGPLSVKNGEGTADNVTNVFEGVNATGTTTSFVRADGFISGNSLNAPNLIISGGTQSIFSGNSSSDLVRITQTGVGNAFVVDDSTNPDTTPFVIDASGNTGIGVTVPDSKLHISNTNSADTNSISLKVIGTGTSEQFLIYRDGRSVINTTTSGVSFNIVNSTQLRTFVNSTGFQILDSGGYGFHHTTTFGGLNVGNTNGYLYLWSQAADTLRLFLGGQDRNPTVARTRTVINPVPSSSTLFNPTGGTAIDYSFQNGGQSVFSPTGGTASYTQIELKPSYSGTGTYSGTVTGLLYNPNLLSMSGTTHRAIQTTTGDIIFGSTSGNVGIGTTSPRERLDVSGNTIISSGLTASTISATTYQNLPLPAFFNFGTASTINWNISGSSNNYTATLTAATTLNVSNVRNGEYGTIILTQDSVGSRTITLGTINGTSGSGRHKVSSGGGGSIYLTSNPNAIDIVSFVYDGNILYWTVGNDYT